MSEVVGDFLYKKKDLIGHGAFAVVFKGRHRKVRTYVHPLEGTWGRVCVLGEKIFQSCFCLSYPNIFLEGLNSLSLLPEFSQFFI